MRNKQSERPPAWNVFIYGIHVGSIAVERARKLAAHLGKFDLEDGRVWSAPIELVREDLEPEH